VDVESAIAQLEQRLAEARPVPLSASVMVNKAEIDEAIAGLRAALPEEIRQSRWVLKERDELLAQANRESEQVLAEAREERKRIVSETEVVREAERESERILAEAREEAEGLRLQADDYIDGKLAGFEIVLQKTMRTVEKGRESLRNRLAGQELSEIELSGEFPKVFDRDPVLDPEGLPASRAPSQFYDQELG
jgi:nucleotide-binding universal stress UspA family protein